VTAKPGVTMEKWVEQKSTAAAAAAVLLLAAVI